MRALWSLDPGVRYLNHGAFGACPTILQDEQAGWRRRMERQPARFFINDLPGLLREAAAGLAAFVGTRADRLGFVDNASTAVNAVIASAPLSEGDEVLTTDHVYNAVRQTLRHHAARAGAVLVEARLGMPLDGASAVVEAVTASMTDRTRLIVLDHVASPSAAIMPIRPIIEAARAAGVPVLVDGAHAPGLIDLDIDASGATWYAGNCHKWLCSPKGAGFLAASGDAPWQVHPTVISHAYGQGFAAEFDKTGTRDVSAWLSVPRAIALHEALGGARLRARNARLARRMASELAAALGTGTGAPPEMFAAMASVRVPGGLTADWPTAGRLRDAIWQVGAVELPVMALGGALWLRLSVQAYNRAEDISALPETIHRAIERVRRGT